MNDNQLDERFIAETGLDELAAAACCLPTRYRRAGLELITELVAARGPSSSAECPVAWALRIAFVLPDEARWIELRVVARRLVNELAALSELGQESSSLLLACAQTRVDLLDCMIAGHSFPVARLGELHARSAGADDYLRHARIWIDDLLTGYLQWSLAEVINRRRFSQVERGCRDICTEIGVDPQRALALLLAPLIPPSAPPGMVECWVVTPLDDVVPLRARIGGWGDEALAEMLHVHRCVTAALGIRPEGTDVTLTGLLEAFGVGILAEDHAGIAIVGHVLLSMTRGGRDFDRRAIDAFARIVDASTREVELIRQLAKGH